MALGVVGVSVQVLTNPTHTAYLFFRALGEIQIMGYG